LGLLFGLAMVYNGKAYKSNPLTMNAAIIARAVSSLFSPSGRA
jgi:hypothetical protein